MPKKPNNPPQFVPPGFYPNNPPPPQYFYPYPLPPVAPQKAKKKAAKRKAPKQKGIPGEVIVIGVALVVAVLMYMVLPKILEGMK